MYSSLKTQTLGLIANSTVSLCVGRIVLYKKQEHRWYFDAASLSRRKSRQSEIWKSYEILLGALSCQWNNAHKKNPKSAISNHTLAFLTCLCIFYSTYWFTHRLLGNSLTVGQELSSFRLPVMSILPPVILVWYADCGATFIFICETYSKQPCSFIPLRFKVGQEQPMCLEYLQILFYQVHLALFSACWKRPFGSGGGTVYQTAETLWRDHLLVVADSTTGDAPNITCWTADRPVRYVQ